LQLLARCVYDEIQQQTGAPKGRGNIARIFRTVPALTEAEQNMGKVTGIGGIFFKASDQEGTLRWLQENLGIPAEDWGSMFKWRDRENPEAKGYTVLGVFKADSDYFDPSPQPFMVNFRVDDLDSVLDSLRSKGIEPVKVFPPEPNGWFAHVIGPDGVKFELWEPAADDPYDP
jgi:lactoylglutathione lyase